MLFMGFAAFLICIALCFALFLSLVKRGRFVLQAKLARFFIVLAALAFFAFWFAKSSIDKFQEESMVLQVINRLPQPIDFYVLKVNKAPAKNKFLLKHLGKIRPEHFRVEYLKMENSDEYWIAGYLGKKNMVYFSQHAVPNKNMDQIIDVKNYINQSVKLSGEAAKEVDIHKKAVNGTSVWVCLDLLLIFLNTVLLVRRK